MKKNQTKNESFHVDGEHLLSKVKELIHEGNIRKITIKDKDGNDIVVFPLTFGVVGVVISPILVAVGALAAVLTECTISVERKTP